MLSILCMPLYIMGIIMLAFANTRPWVVIFGIMGVLDPLRLPSAVVPTRLDLLWPAVHLVPAVLFLSRRHSSLSKPPRNDGHPS